MVQVPFRLTRNLSTFFNAFGVEGIFAVAMMNSAAAIVAKNGNASHVLSMFFRDDIVGWLARRSGKTGEGTNGVERGGGDGRR